MFFLFFFFTVLAEEDVQVSLDRVISKFQELNSLFEYSYLYDIYKEVNGLQEAISNVNSEIAALEQMANTQLEHHRPLDIKDAELAMRFSDKIIEKLALLDTRLINVNDRELLDKIEESVLKMDEYDNELRKSAKKFKENLDNFNRHIKNDHRHYWLVAISLATVLLIAVSLRLISK